MNGPGLRWLFSSASDAPRVACRAMLVLIFFSLAIDATALQRDTWKDVSPSRNPQIKRKVIGCGFFWNKDRGLIGSGVRPLLAVDTFGLYIPVPCDEISIYYTSDGGSNWEEALLPKRVTGAVTQIWMIDSLVGYASIFSDYPHSYYRTFGKSGLWKTSDGGHSWTDPYNYDHILSCVYAQNDLIVTTHWDASYTSYPGFTDQAGGGYSFDGGLTWQRNFRRGNGIAFSDSLNGVVTEMNADTVNMNFWVTVDAGRTWLQTITPLFEAWSIYAIPNERTYFIAGESQYGLPHTTIYKSADGGFIWDPLITINNIHFNGAIAGKGSTVYFQTDTLFTLGGPQLGVYRSDDLGQNWKWVGGPSNSRDTRFCVTGCSGEIVYAFDRWGGVWKTEDGGDGTLDGGNPNDAQMATSGLEFTLSPEECGDTLQFSVFATSCTPVTIDSVVQIAGEDLIHRSPINQTRLREGDSAVVTLVYQPLSDTGTTSTVRVYAHAGYRTLTQDVRFNFQKSLRTAMVLSQDSLRMKTFGCAVAVDSFYVGVVGCPGLVLDSISVAGGELHALSVLPDTLRETDFRPLRFLFAPDSSAVHEYTVTLHGHSNRRVFDTTITVLAESIRAAEHFTLSDTSHAFVTSYCKPTDFSILLGSTSCDTIRIDSIVSSTASFFVSDTVDALPGSGTSSILVHYAPNAVGADSGYIRIVGHSNVRSIDTTIALTGLNNGHTEPLELSDTAVSIATAACQSAIAALNLTNQCCDVLDIDSIYTDGGEFSVEFDRSIRALHSNDTLPLTLNFSPDSGGVHASLLHIRGHIPGRTIDTTIPISALNLLATHPLELARDTVYLPTKYCHSVERTLDLENLGCPEMVIDSAVIENDERHEFSITSFTSPLSSLGGGSITLRFDPDTSGRRAARVRLYAHLGDQFIDTVLTVIGRNFTAPEPYLIPADSQFAGVQLRTAIYFRPTTDTFSVKSFSAHLTFNTDILTPKLLLFDGVASSAIASSSVTEDASGARVDVTYVDSLRESDDLALPVAWLVSDVSLTKDLTTPILLDDFSTDVEPQLTLCSVPESKFTTLLKCGDPILVGFMQTGKASLRILAVQPNPVSGSQVWSVTIESKAKFDDAVLEVYDANGSRESATPIGDLPKSTRSVNVAPPVQSGDYFIVVRNAAGIGDIRRVSVLR